VQQPKGKKENDMNRQDDERREQIVGTGIAVGAGFGVALGLVLMNVFNHPGLFALGIAIGTTLGITISLAIAGRS
jgi:hypothetical protein